MKASPLVSVVVLTCGKKDYFVSCLESLRQQTYKCVEVVLVDNSLDPLIVPRSRAIYPTLKVYRSERNLYYCEGMNQGIALCGGDFVLCLNDDVILDDGFIQEALKGFDMDQRIGMVSGKILRQDRRTLDSTGLFLSLWRTAVERGYGRQDRGQFDRAERVFGVSGAVAFYRSVMLEDLRIGQSWFDPCFRIFYEDLDLAWRANVRGWRGYYMPQALAFHKRGGTVRSESGWGKLFARQFLTDELYKDLIKNRYITIIRNETFRGLWGHLVPMFLYDLCAWAHIVIFRRSIIKLLVSERYYIYAAWQQRCAGKG